MTPAELKERLKKLDESMVDKKSGMVYDRLSEILTVHTVTRPNLRSGEMFVYVGQRFLIDLFDTNDDMSHYQDVSLIYPERWLNIVEQRALFQVIQIRCPLLNKLFVKTHSAFILQCSPSGTVFIIDKPDDYPEVLYTPGIRYSPIDAQSDSLQFIKYGNAD